MDLNLRRPTSTAPLTPQEVKARLHADRLAHASRTWQDVCVKCGTTFSAGSGPRVHCFTCWPARSRDPKPIGHLPRSKVARTQIGADANGVVAGRVRECQRCAYNLFVDVCHIRPVHSFPSSALIREINAPDNLILLCPNCHRELDAGVWSSAGVTMAGIAPKPFKRCGPGSGKAWQTSPYRGVNWDARTQRWRTYIASAGKVYHLGRFADERDAARAYNDAALRLHGERAVLNDVD